VGCYGFFGACGGIVYGDNFCKDDLELIYNPPSYGYTAYLPLPPHNDMVISLARGGLTTGRSPCRALHRPCEASDACSSSRLHCPRHVTRYQWYVVPLCGASHSSHCLLTSNRASCGGCAHRGELLECGVYSVMPRSGVRFYAG
jgi:hypothetical protein